MILAAYIRFATNIFPVAHATGIFPVAHATGIFPVATGKHMSCSRYFCSYR